jgi:prolyl oligopeptidase
MTKTLLGRACALALSAFVASIQVAAAEDDPFQWLEEVDGQKAMAWVKEHNARTEKEFEGAPGYAPTLKKALEILDSKERIPNPEIMGPNVYNFWQDPEHERGIWRRATTASYRTKSPAWETVLDIDALNRAEGKQWVFKGGDCLQPAYARCLVALSRGGGDAVEMREFDTRAKAFVPGGFFLPEAKSNVNWRDENTVWVGTDFGAGSQTTSGYPRIVKLWARGTPLAQAKTVFEGKVEDVASSGTTFFTPEGRYDVVSRTPAFFMSEAYLVLGDRLVKIDVPADAALRGIFKDHVLVSLRSDWKPGETTYREGSLLAIALDDLLRGRRSFAVLFEPSERVSLAGVATTHDHILLSTLDNVRSKLYRVAPKDGAWSREEVALPGLGTASIVSASDEEDIFFFSYRDFLTPDSLYFARGGTAEKVKSLPVFFDSEGIQVAQYEATSKDGTKIPYFVVTPKGFVADGKAPTLLYAYGGFEVSMVPRYSALQGAVWLAKGGVFVQANIRGGGEFGPRWHKAVLKEKHNKNFEDLIAVAEDLSQRRISSPRHLGIMGGSQGGLLVGGAFTQRPDLFNAVVCQVPLLDMRRFNKLLAGASWMAEYGNPDVPEEWATIKTWSPYQNVKKDTKYPKVFFWTTTRDDRVHPAHARKMVAKMESLGHPVYSFENTEGGHGSGAVNKQRAHINAMEYVYLWKMLR